MKLNTRVRGSEIEVWAIFKVVAALIAFSAICAVFIAALNAFVPVADASELIHAFMESFKAGVSGVLGFLAGRAVSRGT